MKESNLRKIRQNVGMSRKELAERSGVSLRMITFYEQGAKDINSASVLTIYRLAKVLQVDMKELLQIEENGGNCHGC